jgi:hypothetical protein
MEGGQMLLKMLIYYYMVEPEFGHIDEKTPP